MKQLFIALLIFPSLSCNPGKPSMSEARICIEKYFTAFSDKNYSAADKFYTNAYVQSEPEEMRLQKMEKLYDVLGPVVSFELADSLEKSTFGEPAEIVLTYHVKHENANTIEKYTVINDEGQHKIAAQSVSNQ